jgi:hypothetical protein
MPTRALSTARTVTATALAATALGTAALGLHLATDQQAARAASVTGTTSSGAAPQPAPRERDDDGALAPSGFGLVQPPLSGGSGLSGGGHTSSHGS